MKWVQFDVRFFFMKILDKKIIKVPNQDVINNIAI